MKGIGRFLVDTWNNVLLGLLATGRRGVKAALMISYNASLFHMLIELFATINGGW